MCHPEHQCHSERSEESPSSEKRGPSTGMMRIPRCARNDSDRFPVPRSLFSFVSRRHHPRDQPRALRSPRSFRSPDLQRSRRSPRRHPPARSGGNRRRWPARRARVGRAARLTGFSLYAPVDGRPAPDSTEVLVWYSAKAIHFGIRAFAEPGRVRASLGDRDKSYNDDYIGIFLATVGRRTSGNRVRRESAWRAGRRHRRRRRAVERRRLQRGARSVASRPTSVPTTSFSRRGDSPSSASRSRSRFRSRACSSATRRSRRGESTSFARFRAAARSIRGRRRSARRRRTSASSGS